MYNEKQLSFYQRSSKALVFALLEGMKEQSQGDYPGSAIEQ